MFSVKFEAPQLLRSYLQMNTVHKLDPRTEKWFLWVPTDLSLALDMLIPEDLVKLAVSELRILWDVIDKPIKFFGS